jgi:hypothetical protein
MQFYDAIRNWRRIKPHLADVEFNRILIEDFNKYTYGRWRKPFPAEGRPYPRSFENCDWDWEHRGREPGYWRYVKHSACHWLVNSNLRLATLVLPDRQWRIVTSQRHSTVWDGDDTLFDFNGQALFKNADEAFEEAFEHVSVQQLKPGRYMTTHFAEHYQIETERHRRGVGEGLCPWCGEVYQLPSCCSEYASYELEPHQDRRLLKMSE